MNCCVSMSIFILSPVNFGVSHIYSQVQRSKDQYIQVHTSMYQDELSQNSMYLYIHVHTSMYHHDDEVFQYSMYWYIRSMYWYIHVHTNMNCIDVVHTRTYLYILVHTRMNLVQVVIYTNTTYHLQQYKWLYTPIQHTKEKPGILHYGIYSLVRLCTDLSRYTRF